MKPYKPPTIRPGHFLAMALRGLAGLLGQWPLLLVVLFFLSPVGPHLRITYSPISCDYLGSHGFVHIRGDRCPLIAIIDSRTQGTP